MQDRPSAAELLRIARETLVGELLPLLPEERKLDVLIIANVMAIAAREAAFGEAPLRAELARLAALYGDKPPPDEPLAAAVERLSRRLAADLRRGAFEDDAADAAKLAEARGHLLETTLQKLRENNPRYLEAEGFE